MKCKNCESENIQVVSHYVEEKEKKEPAIFFVMILIAILTIAGGVFLLVLNYMDKKTEDISRLIGIFLSVAFIYVGIFASLIASNITALLPRKHKTEIKAVCMDCGNVWTLQDNSKPLQNSVKNKVDSANSKKDL